MPQKLVPGLNFWMGVLYFDQNVKTYELFGEKMIYIIGKTSSTTHVPIFISVVARKMTF